MRILSISLGVVLALLALWMIWPSRIDPAYWQEPEPQPMTGVLEPGDELADAMMIGRGLLDSAEDLALGEDGSIYVSQHAGTVVRLFETDDGWQVETIAQVSEKPALGLQWDLEGRLVVAASDGLYAVDVETGEVETLVTEINGRPLAFADDLDIGPDGTIYFSEASWKWPNEHGLASSVWDMAENRPYGELIAYYPDSGATEVLVDGLYFANGVAMSADNRSVFVLETFRYRLSRYWLEGPQAGEWEIIDDNLPGIPDGLLGDGTGRLFIAMDTHRLPLVRFLHANPLITEMLTKLPQSVWARSGPPRPYILEMTEEGEYLASYHAPGPEYGMIANVVPAEDGSLWFGSLTEDYVARYVPDRSASD